mgnify:CR=1 FL=1
MKNWARRGAVLAAAGVLGACVSPARRPSPVEPPAVLATPEEALDAFSVMIASHIDRRDTKFAAFHGCYDWHSAVHGHWALLRIARAGRGTRAAALAADRSLSPQSVAKEASMLRENPAFEMPYGRAWFLLLASEHGRWAKETGASDPERLRPLARETAASMLGYYEKFPPTPHSREYLNASWALARLHDWFVFDGNEAGKEAVKRHLEKGFLGKGGPGFGDDRSIAEFFSPFGVWSYFITTAGTTEQVNALIAQRDFPETELAPVERLIPFPHRLAAVPKPTAHHFGMNWSRAWALKALGRKASDPALRERFTRAYGEHMKRGLADHAVHGADYGAYGHWVPQFAVYALTDRDE